jgi:hypothetical protein
MPLPYFVMLVFKQSISEERIKQFVELKKSELRVKYFLIDCGAVKSLKKNRQAWRAKLLTTACSGRCRAASFFQVVQAAKFVGFVDDCRRAAAPEKPSVRNIKRDQIHGNDFSDQRSSQVC